MLLPPFERFHGAASKLDRDFWFVFRARANGNFSSLAAPDSSCIPCVEPESEGYFEYSSEDISIFATIIVVLIKKLSITL